MKNVEILKLVLEALYSMKKTLEEHGEPTTFNEDQAIIAIRHAIKKADQVQPVAWRSWSNDYGYGFWDTRQEAEPWCATDFFAEPLYTVSPPRQPLPKGEWPKHPSKYVDGVYMGYSTSDLDAYAMQVLAAHGITGEKE